MDFPSRIFRRAALLVAVVLGLGHSARAHDPGLSGLAISVESDHIEAVATFARSDIHALLHLSPGAAPAADELLALAPRVLIATAAKQALAPTAIHVEPRAQNNDVAFQFRYPRPPRSREVSFQSALLSDLAPGHRQYLAVRDAAGRLQMERLLQASAEAFDLDLGPVSAPPAGTPFLAFLRMGLAHILTGYDHLLFLGALLIVSRTFAGSLKIISCFTLGHSITLALATLDIVNVSGRIVEPLIAASIIYVSLENILRRGEPRGRYVLTFAFGLVHGLGFATALREMGVGTGGESVVLPLLGFNLGVELGQIAVAAIVLPAFALLRPHPAWARRWVPACSVVVASAGAYWLVERIAGFGG